MIAYDLRCERGHLFEGWFRDVASYERQAKRKLVACGICGSTKVKRAPMAPAVAGTRSQNTRPAAAAGGTYATHPDAAKAAALVAELRKLRDHVEKNADYVGPRFAEEARRIHYGEVERRSIYGEANDADAAALKEEGVEFARIPWVKPADS